MPTIAYLASQPSCSSSARCTNMCRECWSSATSSARNQSCRCRGHSHLAPLSLPVEQLKYVLGRAATWVRGILGYFDILWKGRAWGLEPRTCLQCTKACEFKCRLRELLPCLCSAAAFAVCLEGRLAGLNATETGNELSQPTFYYAQLTISQNTQRYLLPKKPPHPA